MLGERVTCSVVTQVVGRVNAASTAVPSDRRSNRAAGATAPRFHMVAACPGVLVLLTREPDDILVHPLKRALRWPAEPLKTRGRDKADLNARMNKITDPRRAPWQTATTLLL